MQVQDMEEENQQLQVQLKELKTLSATAKEEIATWRSRWKLTAASNMHLYQQLTKKPAADIESSVAMLPSCIQVSAAVLSRETHVHTMGGTLAKASLSWKSCQATVCYA